MRAFTSPLLKEHRPGIFTCAGCARGLFSIPGDKAQFRIGPNNPSRMRDPDGAGNTKFWIIEVHLVDRDRTFGGFYERLLVPGRCPSQRNSVRGF